MDVFDYLFNAEPFYILYKTIGHYRAHNNPQTPSQSLSL